jgi:hypothetical protein
VNNKEKSMKRFLLSGLAALILSIFVQNSVQAMGLFYTDATYPVTATGTNVPDLKGLKKGSSSTTNILFVVEIGDASIDEAAKKAGIKKISYVDMNEKSVFIFWRQLTINVYGE